MKHEDDEQDVLYTSGPIMTGTAVRALNPGGIAREGILQGYRGGFAQVLWVDLAFTPARYHEGSFVEVTEIDAPALKVKGAGEGLLGYPITAATCEDRGHVGATFNPWDNKTWCLCGYRTYPGNVATHDDCCGEVSALG